MQTLTQLLVAGGVMGVLDFLWLGFVAKKLYQAEIGTLLLAKPNMVAAVLFYAIYVIGIVLMVTQPAIDKGSLMHALGYGALFGFVAYATYDLTNLATLKGFSSKIVVIDMLWGTVLTATVAGVTYAVVTKWLS
jgi:uncharacterized membrane protein